MRPLDSLSSVGDLCPMSSIEPWDQRAARILVRPLANSPIRPNHITALTLVMVVVAGVLFANGNSVLVNWAAGVFVLARFLDHFDGELARLQGTGSTFGYYFDYFVGGIGYAALFIGLGVGHWQGQLGNWALLFGGAGAASAFISLHTNLRIDQELEIADDGDSIGYPGFAGFELEDGIYLLAPVTWLGFLMPFFAAAGIGATIYCLWTIYSLARLRGRRRGG